MKRLTQKFRLFSATICLLAALFAAAAVSNIHRTSELSSSEVVEIDFEKSEAIAQRLKKRDSKFILPALAHRPQKLLISGVRYRAELRFFRSLSERNRHNGFGGYLRT